MKDEKPLVLIVPPGHEEEDKFFQMLFDAHKNIEEFGAFVTILRAEHWCYWWLEEAARLDVVNATIERSQGDPFMYAVNFAASQQARVNADAWHKCAQQWEVQK